MTPSFVCDSRDGERRHFDVVRASLELIGDAVEPLVLGLRRVVALELERERELAQQPRRRHQDRERRAAYTVA